MYKMAEQKALRLLEYTRGISAKTQKSAVNPSQNPVVNIPAATEIKSQVKVISKRIESIVNSLERTPEKDIVRITKK